MKAQRNFTQREEIMRLQAANERLSFIARVSNELVSSYDLFKTLNKVSDFIVPHFADFCNMTIVDEEGKIVEIISRHVDPKKVKLITQIVELFEKIPAEVGTHHILQTGKTQFVPDNAAVLENLKKTHAQAYKIAAQLNTKSYIGVPILLRKKVMGAITFVSTTKNYSKEDFLFAQEFAELIGRALENSRLYERTLQLITESEKKSSFLANASKIMASSLDFQKTLNNVAHLAVPEVADWCMISLVGEDGIVLDSVVFHTDPEKRDWGYIFLKKFANDMRKENVISVVVRTRKPLFTLVDDQYIASFAKTKEQFDIIKRLDFTSVIIMPLLASGKSIGAITLGTSGNRRRYNETDIVMAEEIAIRASLAIENAKLHQRAKRAIAMRDDFMAIASHELRTPITSVKMYAQFLKRLYQRSSEKGLLDYFERMDTQVDKMSTLISDLLNVSKIEHGKLELSMSDFSLDDVAKEAAETVQSTAEKHTVVIQGKIGRLVYGDKERIVQVLINLLTNAIRYSPHSDKVLVELVSQKEQAVISIKDFGVGIPKEDFDTLFDPFYRAVHPKKEADISPGLGLGLYISNQIVKRHDSRITIESAKGKGSTFSFTLPYAE